MKTKEFKERLFDILGTSEELKGKYDVRTNEYVFRPDEEPKAVLTTTPPPIIPQKKTFADVLRDWAPIFTILGGTGGLAAAVYSITRDLALTGLVFAIVMPIGIVILLIIYKLTKKD